MKKIIIVLTVLILAGCVTTEYIYVDVKPDYANPPIRLEMEEPETVQNLAEIIVYYEELLSAWESWGISVYEVLEIPLPDELQLIKDLEG